jgi:hypothetical protein
MIFCVSYAISVWLKRNRTSKAAKTALWRAGFTLFLLGTLGACGYWLLNEYTSQSGIVDGADLFVVHAKRDAVIERLAPEGRIEEGEIITQLRPPAMEGTLAVLENQIKEAQSRIRRASGASPADRPGSRAKASPNSRAHRPAQKLPIRSDESGARV